MSFYEERILPHIIDKACSMGQVMKLRSQLVPRAKGRVLEVGMGSGINLEFYNPETVEMVYGLSPPKACAGKPRPIQSRPRILGKWWGWRGGKIRWKVTAWVTWWLTSPC